MKVYLGDGVYAAFEGYGIMLTTEDGTEETPNRIFLEPEVYSALVRFVEHLNAKDTDK